MTRAFTPYETFTASGARFDFAEPRSADIDARTIGHHLARLNRWTGNTDLTYSVAQHSLLVAQAMPHPAWRIYGLLHDAAEAYTGDLPTPFKQWCVMVGGADVMALERRILTAVYQSFGLAAPGTEISRAVDLADDKVMATEFRDVVAGRHPDWTPSATPLRHPIKPMPALAAECDFLEALEHYLVLAKRQEVA